MRLFRPLIYAWAFFPATAIGLLFAISALLSGGGVQIVDGVLEAHGGFVDFYLRRVVGLVLTGGASAMTLGHVVIGRDRALLQTTRTHERVHVRQCERWGPLFIPTYFFFSALQWFRGRRPYEDNPFEREAFGR